MKILAIDTSCDETSVAVTEGLHIHANIISSQVDEHAVFGGVVPFLAQRLHKERIEETVELALSNSGFSLHDIDAIAVTQGPGLAPALEVGVAHAKMLSLTHNLPLYAVNHMAGHIASCFSTSNPPRYPMLALLLSGGHSEMVYLSSWTERRMLGATLDDAIGEAYDKVAKLVGLGYPGGKKLADAASHGDENSYELPIPMQRYRGYDLSYSGLKNAVRLLIQSLGGTEALSQGQVCDIAASFERVAQESILIRLRRVLRDFADIRVLAFGGGVSANTRLRRLLQAECHEFGVTLMIPADFSLCTDNAAMIGMAAHLDCESGLQAVAPDHLERAPGLRL